MLVCTLLYKQESPLISALNSINYSILTELRELIRHVLMQIIRSAHCFI